MFKNLKVRTKILTGFGTVMVLYIIAVIASAIGLSSVADGLQDFYYKPYPMVQYALKAQFPFRKVLKRAAILNAV